MSVKYNENEAAVLKNLTFYIKENEKVGGRNFNYVYFNSSATLSNSCRHILKWECPLALLGRNIGQDRFGSQRTCGESLEKNEYHADSFD